MNTCKLVDLNNSAVASLQQGRHKQAVALLKTAIAELKDHFVVVHEQQAPRFSSSSGTVVSEPSDEMHWGAPSSSACTSSNGAYEDERSSSMRVDQKQDKPAILSVLPLWTEETFERKDDKTLIFMYAQALVLDPVDHCKEVLVAVVLYNMALASHVRAIDRDKSSDLKVALNFYGMAVTIIQGQDGVNVNASTYWLLLALYNNMAQIYLSQNCSEKLRRCLGNIQTVLAADRIGQVIDFEDYGFFLTNAMLELSVVASPAA
jgi:hypothetical protein